MSLGFLKDLKVLDLSQYLPGPYATRMLADFGAAVVKVEPPGGDPAQSLDSELSEGASLFYNLLNEGKTVVNVDLKSGSGKRAVETLVAAADVLLESFRPGVLDRLGFGEERLKQLNPRLVHCALSGYGQSGPYRLVSGHDLNYEAMTGALNLSGGTAAPGIPYPPVADYAGAMQSVIAILAAVRNVERTGQGCFLDVSITEALLAWQGPALTQPPPRGDGILNGGSASYHVYRTADDEFISLSPMEPKFWASFCNAVGRPDWIGRQYREPMPQTALIGEVAALISTHPLAHWEALLVPADCCYHAVLDHGSVASHPHHADRGVIHRRDGIVDILLPLHVDGEKPTPRAPRVQADVDAVIKAWGSES